MSSAIREIELGQGHGNTTSDARPRNYIIYDFRYATTSKHCANGFIYEPIRSLTLRHTERNCAAALRATGPSTTIYEGEAASVISGAHADYVHAQHGGGSLHAAKRKRYRLPLFRHGSVHQRKLWDSILAGHGEFDLSVFSSISTRLQRNTSPTTQ